MKTYKTQLHQKVYNVDNNSSYHIHKVNRSKALMLLALAKERETNLLKRGYKWVGLNHYTQQLQPKK